ncbi:hypothetical protein Taro_026489, partial [Colocasia esculenta]|nr:hypothetical protein [Colocasia esculenta]
MNAYCAGHGECLRGFNLVLGAESHSKIHVGAIDGTIYRRPRSSSPLAGRRRRRRSPVSIRCPRRLLQHDHITPWAQSTQSTEGSTWSTGDPFIANESPAASVSTRGIQG